MKLLVPETLQTSGMDCGPAALKSLLAGLGVHVSYERLREASHTSADGTSIDVMEELCGALGLEAGQELAPLTDAAEVLRMRAPAIAVAKGPGGSPHFIVVWRVMGPLVQVMDPGRGRRWVTREDLARELFVHEQAFDDALFRRWFPATGWHEVFARRLQRLGLDATLDATRRADDVAAMDAAARMVERIAARTRLTQADRRGLFDSITRGEAQSDEPILPEWLSARGRDAEGRFVCRGCVFLSVKPRASAGAGTAPLGEAVQRILVPDGPGLLRVLVDQLTPHTRRLVVLLSVLATLVACLAAVELVFLRAVFNAGALVSLPQQRFAGMLLYAALVGLVLAIEVAFGAGIVRLGRSVELRLRVALLQKLPRLPDHYFRTRPMSDVAHRSRGLVDIKPLPELFATIGKQSLDVVVTLFALALIHPRGLPWLALAALFGVLVPFFGVGWRKQIESRVQAHASALGQIYLDTLLGLVPLRTHGARHAVRALQERYLVDWRLESQRSVRLLSLTEALQSLGVLGALVPFVLGYIATNDSQGALLLMAFWALRLPVEARVLSASLQRIAPALSSAARLVEPLTAAEVPLVNRDEVTRTMPADAGLSIEARNLSVVLTGQRILKDVSFSIRRGEKVAVIGTSGAGKSTLLSVLLGLLDTSTGSIRIDGVPLSSYDVGKLRREAVWVDPTVQLWNRSTLHNLQFGNPRGARHPLESVLEQIDLKSVIDRMPLGLATPLGESGARVSGGEGQRVRIARALMRSATRLVLLDEAFRGLDREARRAMSRTVRELAGSRTVIEVTHDVADTREFDRVLVIEEGTLVEQGAPDELLAKRGSRYAELINADAMVLHGIWDDTGWRHVRVEQGGIRDHEPDEGLPK